MCPHRRAASSWDLPPIPTLQVLTARAAKPEGDGFDACLGRRPGRGPLEPRGVPGPRLRMYEKDLEEQLGLPFEMVAAETLGEVEAAVLGHPADVAFVMVSWREDPAEVVGLFRRLSGRIRPGCCPGGYGSWPDTDPIESRRPDPTGT